MDSRFRVDILQPNVRVRSSQRSEARGQMSGLWMGENIERAGMQVLDFSKRGVMYILAKYIGKRSYYIWQEGSSKIEAEGGGEVAHIWTPAARYRIIIIYWRVQARITASPTPALYQETVLRRQDTQA